MDVHRSTNEQIPSLWRFRSELWWMPSGPSCCGCSGVQHSSLMRARGDPQLKRRSPQLLGLWYLEGSIWFNAVDGYIWLLFLRGSVVRIDVGLWYGRRLTMRNFELLAFITVGFGDMSPLGSNTHLAEPVDGVIHQLCTTIYGPQITGSGRGLTSKRIPPCCQFPSAIGCTWLIMGQY